MPASRGSPMELPPQGHEVEIVDLGPLTPREAETLLWAAEGKTSWEAGTILGIAESTTVQYLTSTARKLHASNRAHLVTKAFVKGILVVRRGATVALVTLAIIAGGVIPDLDIDKWRPHGGSRLRRREDEIC